MNEFRDIPHYKCHKVVRALKIKSIVSCADDSVNLHFFTHNMIHIDKPECQRFKPFGYESEEADKGYFVVYDDDYLSWSPTEAFESGYTRL